MREIKVLYFASLADALAQREENLALPDEIATTGDLRQWLAHNRDGGHALANNTVRVALNQVLVKTSQVLSHGDEVAFFPPVTGG